MGCSVFKANKKQFGEDSEDFLRAMLAEGPFTSSSRFASLNVLTKQFGRAVPEDYPLPPIPKHPRRSVNRCVKDCVFKNTGCKGGRNCRRARDLAAGAMIGELQEGFVGPIQEHIWWGREPPPVRKRSPQEQLEVGLMEAEAALPSPEEVAVSLRNREEAKRQKAGELSEPGKRMYVPSILTT